MHGMGLFAGLRSRGRGGLWIVGAAVAASALLALLLWSPPPAHATATKKTYTAVAAVSPAAPEDDAPGDAAVEVWAGATPRLSVTITNTSSPSQKLGSVNISIPAGITPLAGTTSITSTQSPFGGTVALSGAQLQLRNLTLAGGRSVTVSVDIRVRCAPAQPAYLLDTAAKQANDFNGTGNDFQRSGPAPALDAAGTCSLAFLAQPASAQRETDITSEVYRPFSASPPGAPVTVKVRDGSGSGLVTWWTTPVTLGLSSNPGAATLHGAVSATPVAGVASFTSPAAAEPGPRIGVSASGYRFTASSSGIPAASAPSSPFDIVDVGKVCEGASCAGASTSNKSRAEVSAVTNAGDVLRLSLGAVGTPAPLCAGYTATTDTLDFDYTTTTGVSTGGQRTIVMTLLKAFVTKPPWKYDACFQSTLPFKTNTGAPAVLSGGYYTGLLPQCNWFHPKAPCEVATVWTWKGDVVMTLIAPPGDPRARF